jgi:hypothetical protein
MKPLVTGFEIDEALKKAGFANNLEFVSDFKKYREIEQKARELQLRALQFHEYSANQILKISMKQEENTNGWRFMDIKIEGTFDMLEKVLKKDLQTGTGLFSNITEIAIEDEKDDEFLGIDDYGLKCSLESYYRELQKYGIISSLFKDGKKSGCFYSFWMSLSHSLKITQQLQIK